MSEEKMIKNEELSEEQLDKVSGGSPEDVDPSKESRYCANPSCGVKLPYNYPNKYCRKCMMGKPGTRPRPIDTP